MQELLSFIVSAVAVAAAVWILHHGRSEFRTLERDARQLREDLGMAGAILRNASSREEFARTFDQTSQRLVELPIFGPVWDEFRESLVVFDMDARLVMSARDPYEFLGPRLLDASEVDQRRIEAVPNRLIAYGLIFTFIGLVLSLVIASFGLTTDDLAQIRMALTGLLAAAAIKFITSIFGIYASIQFTHKRSELLNQIDTLSAEICKQLDRLTYPLRADVVAEASHRELQQQTALLQRGNEDLATTVAARLDETLRDNLGSAIQPVADQIDAMGRNIADMNQRALSEMVEKFSKELGGAAREHSERMTTMLYQVERTIADLPSRIEGAGDRFSDQLKTATDDMERSLDRAGNNFGEVLVKTEQELGVLAGQFGRVSELLGGTIERLERTETGAAERIDRAESTLTLAVQQISTVIERADTAIAALAPLTAMASQMEALARSLERANDGTAQMLARSVAMLDESRAASDGLARSAQAFAASTTQLQGAIAGVFERMAAGIDIFRSRIEETIENADSASAEISSRLLAAVRQVEK